MTVVSHRAWLLTKLFSAEELGWIMFTCPLLQPFHSYARQASPLAIERTITWKVNSFEACKFSSLGRNTKRNSAEFVRFRFTATRDPAIDAVRHRQNDFRRLFAVSSLTVCSRLFSRAAVDPLDFIFSKAVRGHEYVSTSLPTGFNITVNASRVSAPRTIHHHESVYLLDRPTGLPRGTRAAIESI